MQIKVIASGSSGNAYILEDDGEQVLIEAGVPWRKIQQAMEFNTRNIKFCLVSHSHLDHAGYLQSVQKAGIDCYGPVSFYRERGLLKSTHRFYGVSETVPGYSECAPNWYVQSFSVPHNVPCVGFIITKGGNRVLFLPDSQYSPYKFGPGLTYLLLSVNYSKETLSPNIHPSHRSHVIDDHLSLETCLELLKANDLRKVVEIHLLHCSTTNSDIHYFKAEVEKQTGIPTYIGGE